jgi:hypothetical protein
VLAPYCYRQASIGARAFCSGVQHAPLALLVRGVLRQIQLLRQPPQRHLPTSVLRLRRGRAALPRRRPLRAARGQLGLVVAATEREPAPLLLGPRLLVRLGRRLVRRPALDLLGLRRGPPLSRRTRDAASGNCIFTPRERRMGYIFWMLSLERYLISLERIAAARGQRKREQLNWGRRPTCRSAETLMNSTFCMFTYLCNSARPMDHTSAHHNEVAGNCELGDVRHFPLDQVAHKGGKRHHLPRGRALSWAAPASPSREAVAGLAEI